MSLISNLGEKQSITYLIDKCSKNPVEKRNEIETMIKNKLNEHNINFFLESNLTEVKYK